MTPFSGWMAVGAGVLFQAVTFGVALYSFTFLVIPWSEEFGAGRSEIMSASVAMSVGAGLLGPLVGRLLDSFAVRTVVIAGLMLYATGMLVAGAASTFAVVIAAYGLLIGPGMVCAGPIAGQVLVAQAIPEARRGLAFGLVLTGTSLGGILFPPIVAALMESPGWRFTLSLLGPGAAVLVLPLVWLYAPQKRVGERLEVRGKQAESKPARASSIRDILGQIWFWIPVIAVVPAMTAFVGVQFNLDPFARQLGVVPTEASMVMSLLAAATIGSKIVFGYLTDRWDVRGLCALSLTLMVAALLMLARSTGVVSLGLTCFLLGIASGSLLPLVSTVFMRYFGAESFGRALGFAMPLIALSGVGGLLAGWMFEYLDGYIEIFRALAAMVAIGGVAAWLLSTTQRVVAVAADSGQR